MEDLFDHPELQPSIVQSVLEIYGCPVNYDDCDELVQKLNEIGWTCEYGLDANPYNLSKL